MSNKKSTFSSKDKNILSGKLSTGVKEKLTQAAKIATGCAVIAVTGVLMHKKGHEKGYDDGFDDGFTSGRIHATADVAWFEKETGEAFLDHCEYHFGGGKVSTEYSDEFIDKANEFTMRMLKSSDHIGSKMKKEEEA